MNTNCRFCFLLDILAEKKKRGAECCKSVMKRPTKAITLLI